jgi:glycosyltransferase involved in cell wall biosynthesis
MVGFHFPPVHGSSGVQRTLKFARYLPEHGWEPAILTADPRAYEATHSGQLAEIDGMIVRRAFALDTRRHIAIGGRYPGFLAMPDRWSTWMFGAVPAGLAMIRRYRPDVIWSTFPIATAHRIGHALHRLSGVPWIADFRDSMTEEGFPEDTAVRRSYLLIERRAVANSRFAVFTTPGAREMYARRYPAIPADRWQVIENGYDEEDFAGVPGTGAARANGGPLVLLHSGILYPSERDPTAFFRALGALRDAGEINPDTLCVRLRATGHDEHYRGQLAALCLSDIVRLEPPIGYHTALAEMAQADGLLLFQASNCNHQIPAKLYEYLRARRPIIALTDPAGDTATVLRRAGITTIAPLDDAGAIAVLLREMLPGLRSGSALAGNDAEVRRYSRRARTAELASLLDRAAARA